MQFVDREAVRRAVVSLGCALLTFVIVEVTAWYNLRGVGMVCSRQYSTHLDLRILEHMIEGYVDKTESLPEKLTDIPYVQDEKASNWDSTLDAWRNPIQYRVTEGSFELFSYGRDGQPGGRGLDADLYSDGRNREQSLATFRQYFSETDIGEVDRSRFTLMAAMAALFAACAFWQKSGEKREVGFRQLLVQGGITVAIACVVGGLLLPLHVPSGH